MDAHNPSDPFDDPSKHVRKKKKKIKRKSALEAPPSNMSAAGDTEIDTMLKKLRNMDDDLQNRMEKIAELSGMSTKEVKRFIENPDNFPSEEWSRIQRKKDDLEKKIYAGIGIEYQKRVQQKKKKKMQKGRRGKTLGSRKGWIQM